MMKANRYTTLGSITAALTLVALLVVGLSTGLVYRSAYQEQLHSMTKEVEGLAGLMESVAQFDRRFSSHTRPQGSLGATLGQIENGLKARSAIYSSEEIYLGRKDGDRLVVLQVHPTEGFKEISREAFDGQLSQGLYWALHDNRHGNGEVIDFNGQRALAAYAPVPSLGIALVNHIRLDEFRAPFIRAALWSMVIGLLLVGLASAALSAYTRPLQRRLEESERRSSARSAAAPVGVYETDVAGHCIYVNDRWCELAGMSRNEALGDGWIRALHPDDAQQVNVAWQEFTTRHAPFNLEYRFRQSNGKVLWLAGQAVALTDVSGEITGYTGTITDITELKLAQARFNEAQRLAKIGSWELDLQTNQLLWSNEIFHLFEIDQTKFGATYEAFLNAIHPDDREAVNKAYTGSLNDRKPYEIVHRLMMTDGRIKYVRETCETFFSAEGRPLRSVGTVQDVTELHKAELQLREYRDHLEDLVTERAAALKQTSQMLQTVLDTVPLRIFWKDRELNYIGCNRVFAEDAGNHTPQELVGKSDYDMAWKATADLYRQDDAQVIATGQEKLAFEEPMELPDGSRIWLSTSKVPLRDADGVITGVLGTYENITARKQAEKALVNAKNDAERANRAKNEFLSRMSHELRTPMNAILGFGQILELESLTGNQKESVGEILRAGQHLLVLIDELLDLSRIEAGRLDMLLEPVNLASVTNTALKLVSAIVKEQNISIHNRLEGSAHHYAVADNVRLRQVLVNLLSNAAKYNRAGGLIRIACDAPDSEHLRVSITDTGPGIPPEKQGSLFKPFERLGAEFSDTEGTGIGLALSKQLIELMGGTIGMASTPGEGTTFWFDLPCVTPALAASSDQNVDNGSAAKDIPQVLYVEDNPANVRLVKQLFSVYADMSLITAATGETGIDLASQHQPGLILLDIHLPGIDGYETLRRLRANPVTSHIPVIALSADAMPLDVKRGLAAGFVRYITKPVVIEELLDAVKQAMRTRVTQS